jgi:hypothetical protein
MFILETILPIPLQSCASFCAGFSGLCAQVKQACNSADCCPGVLFPPIRLLSATKGALKDLCCSCHHSQSTVQSAAPWFTSILTVSPERAGVIERIRVGFYFCSKYQRALHISTHGVHPDLLRAVWADRAGRVDPRLQYPDGGYVWTPEADLAVLERSRIGRYCCGVSALHRP